MDGNSAVHLILAFIGIVVVLFLSYYLTRLYAKRMGTMFYGGSCMKVIDRIAVGKGSAIAVVELQGKQYLVGVTESSINLLKELEEPIELPAAVKPEAPSFLRALKSVVTKDSENENADDDEK